MNKLPPDRSHVATEQRHHESHALDALATTDIVTLLVEDQHRAVDAVKQSAAAIAAFADAVAHFLQREQGGIDNYIDELCDHSPFKSTIESND